MRSDPYVGTVVGRYRVERLLGRGGMGVVYVATDLETGGPVALKLMLPTLGADESFRRRFVREAELAPSLEHPHIVRVVEAGEWDDELFIVMDLVNGPDLKRLIATEGPLRPDRALAITSQIGSALDLAHANGVVHRDVKPQNILVEPGGVEDKAFITDFGIVKRLSAASAGTRSGELLGSVHYMAPEQIESKPVDGRADVYSLGCVVYEMLTGAVPFDRDTEAAVLLAQLEEAPPPMSKRVRDLPGGLDDAVLRCLEKEPQDRFLTCGEFVDELRAGAGRKRRTYFVASARRRHDPARGDNPWAPDFFGKLDPLKERGERLSSLRTTAILLLALALAFFGLRYKTGLREVIERGVGDSGEVAARAGPGGAERRPSGPPFGRDATASEGRRANAGRREAAGEGTSARDDRRDGPVTTVAPSPREVPRVAAAPIPKSGTYTYGQYGYEQLCRDVAGSDACGEGADLPSRYAAVVDRRPGDGDPVVATTVHWSDRWTVRVVARHTGDGVFVTALRFELDGTDGFTAELQPDAPVETVRFGASAGDSWESRWDDENSETSATSLVQVERVERIRVAGRTRSAVVVRITTTFEGAYEGTWEDRTWIDALTSVVLKRTGSVAFGPRGRDYRSSYASTLRGGPGYS